MGHINFIKIAMLVFSVLAFFITLPYMITNHRTYVFHCKPRTNPIFTPYFFNV